MVSVTRNKLAERSAHASRIMQKFISPLRAVREARKLTLKELAARTGLSIGTIGNYETGERGISVEALRKISAVLQVEVAEITQKDEGISAPSFSEVLTSTLEDFLHIAVEKKDWAAVQVMSAELQRRGE